MTTLLVLLFVLAAAYVALCAVLWSLQDRMVFPGAGGGDRGVPASPTPAVVGWLGEPGKGPRLATFAVPAPKAVALYFGGNGEDLFAAAYSAGALAEHGVEAVCVEYPGYGATPGRPSMESLLATADAAVVHARSRARALGVPLVVVGSSLGTFCAVHTAAAGGVDRLVLRAPPTTLAAVASGTFWWLPLDWLLAHRFDNLAAAARVQCPALVLHGDCDTIVSDKFGRELAAALPRAEFVSVPGCGHNDIDLSPTGPSGAKLREFLLGR